MINKIFMLFSFFVMGSSVSVLQVKAQAEEKKLVVVIPSYNNADCYQKNLDSVFKQNYTNWHIIYIDDVSIDGTGNLVDSYVKKQGLQDRVTLIRNTERFLAMANLYRAIYTCDDDAIIVTLDGDDWFAHDQVLMHLNTIYQDPDVWLTYGSYTDYPEPEAAVFEHWMNTFGGFGNRPIPQHIIEDNDFRSFIGCTGQLRTFYAWLFKQIKIEDLMYKGSFLPMTYDVGIMIPMHEMAQGRFRYVSEVLYIHNLNTPINDHKVDAILQGNIEKYIRNRPKYQALSAPRADFFDQFKQNKVALVLFSYDRPMQLYALLESLTKYVSGIESITVIYRVSNSAFDSAYEQVNHDFSTAYFVKQRRKEEFKPLVLQAIKQTDMQHIMFSVDDIIVKDYVDLSAAVCDLEQMQAYGFYLRLGTHLSVCYSEQSAQKVPCYVKVNNSVSAWQFDYGEYDWNYPNTLDMTLYRKKDLFALFEQLDFSSPNTLEGSWALCKPSTNVGIFYQQSKIVNIPLNLVQQEASGNPHMNFHSTKELLEKFEQGLKIDIAPLYMIANESAHIEYEPTFIARD